MIFTLNQLIIILIVFCLIILIILCLSVFWLLYVTEFSYFGRRITKFLYDLFSPLYQLKWKRKAYEPEIEEKLFLKPIRKACENKTNLQVIDLACGTGRLSILLAKQTWFTGTIQSYDFSDGMLSIFEAEKNKLKPEEQSKITIYKMNLLDWPTEELIDNNYDLVILTEAGEFLPNFVSLVEKIAKRLKPGALFLLTKPPDQLGHLYPNRKQTKKDLTSLLESQGFTEINIFPWSSRYEVVEAWK